MRKSEKFWTEYLGIRDEIIKEIIAIIKAHNGAVADFAKNSDNCPVVQRGDDDFDTYTTDSVGLNNNEQLVVYFSSSAGNNWDNAKFMSVECLIEILEEMEINEHLFDEDEDEE